MTTQSNRSLEDPSRMLSFRLVVTLRKLHQRHTLRLIDCDPIFILFFEKRGVNTGTSHKLFDCFGTFICGQRLRQPLEDHAQLAQLCRSIRRHLNNYNLLGFTNFEMKTPTCSEVAALKCYFYAIANSN